MRSRLYGLAVILAAFTSGSPAHAEGEETWRSGNNGTCNFEARTDKADICWLNNSQVQQQYKYRAKRDDFDFVGPADLVPFRSGRSEVWISACANSENFEHWFKFKAGPCPTQDEPKPDAPAKAAAAASAPKDKPPEMVLTLP